MFGCNKVPVKHTNTRQQLPNGTHKLTTDSTYSPYTQTVQTGIRAFVDACVWGTLPEQARTALTAARARRTETA